MLPAERDAARHRGLRGLLPPDAMSAAPSRRPQLQLHHPRPRPREIRARKKARCRRIAEADQPQSTARAPSTLTIRDSYYNMKEKIRPCMDVVECAEEAMREVGVDAGRRAHPRRHRRRAPVVHGSAVPQPGHGRLRGARAIRARHSRGHGEVHRNTGQHSKALRKGVSDDKTTGAGR